MYRGAVMVNFKELLSRDEYHFLKETNTCKIGLCFLTLGGSHAYGTNNETWYRYSWVCSRETPDLIA